MKLRVGVDVGGTFADIVIIDSENGNLVKVAKVPTLAGSLMDDIVSAVSTVKDAGIAELVLLHGTTLGLNTLLQKKGSRVALVTTAGFRDTYEIGRQWRGEESIYDIFYRPPTPLVPRDRVLEVVERVNADGKIEKELTEDDLEAMSRRLEALDVDAVAVCLLFSFLNPAHEQRIASWLRERHPNLSISLSSEVAPEFREYERTSTVVIDAYVKPTVRQYLSELSDKASAISHSSSIYVMRSGGGLTTIDEAANLPAQSLFSGPVGGVMGACHLSEVLGWDKVITIDMGGTSTDIALVLDGKPVLSKDRAVEGRPVNVPSVDVHSIGSGGGSIASTLMGKVVQVGPHSAGAMPGPVCYGRGGRQPTLTDAWLVLGHLHESLLDGALKLDKEGARAAIEAEIARPLGMDVIEAAGAIVDIATSQAYELMRLITVERGYDPREFRLLSFGGAGPVYAAAVARDLGIPTVCVPHLPGLFSAAGFLVSDLTQDFARSSILDARPSSLDEINRIWSALEAQALKNYPGATLTRFVDMRYGGQAYEVMVPAAAGAWRQEHLADSVEQFHAAHKQRYGMDARDEPVQCVVFRVRATLPMPKYQITPQNAVVKRAVKPESVTQAIFAGKSFDTGVFRRSSLRPGDFAAGPSIILEYDTTVVVYPSQSFHVDSRGNILVETGI